MDYCQVLRSLLGMWESFATGGASQFQFKRSCASSSRAENGLVVARWANRVRSVPPQEATIPASCNATDKTRISPPKQLRMECFSKLWRHNQSAFYSLGPYFPSRQRQAMPPVRSRIFDFQSLRSRIYHELGQVPEKSASRNVGKAPKGCDQEC
jgi:hypothetical protein